MTPVFSFVAWSGTGKTTYLEKLVAALTARGVRVGAVKHDGHSLTLDREGKDSWRYARAGAKAVAVCDAEKAAVMDYRPRSLDELLASLRDVDMVLVEGWHADARNPIVLHRAACGKPPKLDPTQCFAAVSDVALDAGETPVFPLDDPEPLADFLLRRAREMAAPAAVFTRRAADLRRSSPGDIIGSEFGFDTETEYDALVLSSSWTPETLCAGEGWRVTPLVTHAGSGSYLAELGLLRLAWVRCGPGAHSVLDHMLCLAPLRFRRAVFAGAVGGLTEESAVGDLCTPAWCINGSAAPGYLCDRLAEARLFDRVYPDPEGLAELQSLAAARGWTLRTLPVFCTDSITLEYSHLDEIRAMGAALIEMETAAFFTAAAGLGVRACAILAESDNFAADEPFFCCGEAARRCRTVRSSALPALIADFAALA